jgi:hypothetical protein
MPIIPWRFVVKNISATNANFFGFQLGSGEQMDFFHPKFNLHEGRIMQGIINGDIKRNINNGKVIVVDQYLGYDYRYHQDQVDVTAELNAAPVSNFADYVTGVTSAGEVVRLSTPIATDVDYRKLAYFVDEGPSVSALGASSYKEVIGGAFPTSEIWWTTSAKLVKIVELIITRDAEQKPTAEVWKLYSADGLTVVEQVADTVAYLGPFEQSRTRSIS